MDISAFAAMNDIEVESFFTVTEQTRLFLFSVGIGVLLGLLFDAFRALRVIFPMLRGTVPTALCDILYLLICSFSLYLFSLVFARGQVRLFYWAGAFLGAVIYLMTAGTVIMGIIRTVFGALYTFLHKLFTIILKPFTIIFGKIRTKLNMKFVENAKKTAKALKSKQNYLKRPLKMLYNKSNKKMKKCR